MFIIPGKCPVCYSAWGENEICPACGGIAEIYFEREIPSQEKVDLARLQRVIDSARTRLIQFPNDGNAHYILGMAYIHIGLLTEGAEQINTAAGLFPEKIQIRYEAAVLATKLGANYEDSLAELNKILEREPQFKEAQYLRGVLLDNIGDKEAAIRAWQKTYLLDKYYKSPKQKLDEFISSERQYISSPTVLKLANIKKINNQTLRGLKELSSARPEPPPRMGKTSMQILEYIDVKTARRMKGLYAEDVTLYKDASKRREQDLRLLDDDLLSMADICLISYELRRKQAAKATLTEVAVDGALSIAERSEILEAEIEMYQKNGYRLVSQTDTTAQLYRPKQFSCCVAVILVLLVIGIFLYLIYYLIKKDDSVFIVVDKYGKVKKTHS